MARSVTLEPEALAYVEAEIASGRFRSARDVVVHALHVAQDKAQRQAEVAAAIDRGIADVDAGRDCDADEFFDELEARYASSEAFAARR